MSDRHAIYPQEDIKSFLLYMLIGHGRTFMWRDMTTAKDRLFPHKEQRYGAFCTDISVSPYMEVTYQNPEIFGQKVYTLTNAALEMING